MTAIPANRDGRDVYLRLRALIQDFDRDSMQSRQQIRDLLETGAEGFYRAAIEILKQPADSRGEQFLVVLLITNGFLFRALCDPALSREQTVELARCALRMDATADVSLARTLADSVEATHDPAQLALAGRLLEILDEITDSPRIFSSLMRLLRHSNSYLRSKVVLMIGRGNKSVKWVRQKLSDDNARIRANALESLWGINTEEARELLQSTLRDPDNRAVGNSLLGLYRLGESGVIAEICRRAADRSPAFRATSAWVMGETGDPRFAEVVAGMLKDPSGPVRKRAFSAMGKMKRAAALLARAPSFSLAARVIGTAGTQSGLHLSLAIGSQDGAMPPRILPTQIVLTEDGKAVTAYSVTERTPPENMSVAFLLPRGIAVPGLSWSASALECLGWKRLGDAWGCFTYLPEASPGTGSANDDERSFLIAPEAISTDFRKRRSAAQCTDVWSSLSNALRPENRTGKRQVIVFSGTPVAGSAGPDLVAAASASRALVQVISLRPDEALKSFCDSVDGVYFQCVDHDDFAADVVRAYLNLLPRYEIHYRPVDPEWRQIRVRLCHPRASGETMVAVARQPLAGPDSEETQNGQ